MVQSRTQSLNASQLSCAAINLQHIPAWSWHDWWQPSWLTHHVQSLALLMCAAGWRCGTFLLLPLLPNSRRSAHSGKSASATSTVLMPVSESVRPANQHHGNTIPPPGYSARPILVTLNSNESEGSAGLRLSSWGWNGERREWGHGEFREQQE